MDKITRFDTVIISLKNPFCNLKRKEKRINRETAIGRRNIHPAVIFYSELRDKQGYALFISSGVSKREFFCMRKYPRYLQYLRRRKVKIKIIGHKKNGL